MSKVKTQYGDLTERQWKLVVVEKLIAIEKLLIKVAEMSAWTDETKIAINQATELVEMERRYRELERLSKERESINKT